MVGYEPKHYQSCATAGCLHDLMTCDDEILISWAINMAKEDEALADAMIDFRIFEQPHYVPLKPMYHEPIQRRGGASCVYK